MTETVLLAIIFAKIRGNRVGLLFKSWTISPFLAVEVMYIFFQIQVFTGNYYFIQFAPFVKRIYLFCLVVPVIVYKEYLQGLIGSGFVLLGTLMNRFVMA
ncbi:MAG: hypothetical protein WCR87_07480, partial [Saccharofermentanales bacterium]